MLCGPAQAQTVFSFEDTITFGNALLPASNGDPFSGPLTYLPVTTEIQSYEISFGSYTLAGSFDAVFSSQLVDSDTLISPYPGDELFPEDFFWFPSDTALASQSALSAALPGSSWNLDFLNLDDFSNSSLAGAVNSASITAVPLPAALWLFGAGLLGLATAARHKRTQ